VSDSIPDGWTQGGEEMPEPLGQTVRAALAVRLGDQIEVVTDENGKPGAEFRRGWRAACEAAAQHFEKDSGNDIYAWMTVVDFLADLEPPEENDTGGAAAEDTPTSP
jgi:hypothetical protein